jgi:hypothetical protein
MTTTPLIRNLIAVARAAGAVANYCDHAEHNEIVEAAWVLEAGRTLREVAQDIAKREGVDIFAAYSRRLGQVEARAVGGVQEAFDGARAAAQAATWEELQQVQLLHDRTYHLDVVGLHKAEQLRHYALHLAKLTAALADVVEEPDRGDDFLRRRLPDLLLFGLKLPTVMGRTLPNAALPIRRAVAAATAA